jgi:tetrahydromethanopterin S-methyltransferase subunit G
MTDNEFEYLARQIEKLAERLDVMETETRRRIGDVSSDLERRVESVVSDLNSLEHKVDYG